MLLKTQRAQHLLVEVLGFGFGAEGFRVRSGTYLTP